MNKNNSLHISKKRTDNKANNNKKGRPGKTNKILRVTSFVQYAGHKRTKLTGGIA